MSDYERPFGKPEGIEKRLAMWANQLGRDKTYPWIGLGIIDDLKCAAEMLGGEPFDKLYPSVIPKPAAPAPVEYDL
jgi:hypothetical protein